MSISPQYLGKPVLRLKSVYYAGTDELLPGYVLCYTHDATVGASDGKLAKGTQVSKPATANLMLFAGVVQKKVQGPAWVEIAVPQRGEAISVLHKVNATKEVTALTPQNGQYGLGAFSDATLNLPLCGIALETADTSTTAANKLALFR